VFISYSDLDDRPPLIRCRQIYIKIVAASRLVKVLNVVPFVDMNGLMLGNAVHLVDGNRKWGLLGQINWPVVYNLTTAIAECRLNYSSVWSFYWAMRRKDVRKKLRQLMDDQQMEYHRVATRPVSESTC
jgi:hypothetical protein